MAETKYLDYDGLAELVAQLKAYADAKAEGAGDFDALVARTIEEATDDDGSITKVGTYAFYSCDVLTSVDLPVCESVGASAFCDCDALASADLSLLESVGKAAFAGCAMASLDLPALTTITAGTSTSGTNRGAFADIDELESADLGAPTSIPAYTFRSCDALASLTIRTDSVATLTASALTGTAIADGDGWIYVPADLVDEYKAASNWSTYADQIVAIEE